jgi:acetylornithine/N-succinyldiaminopimelate aminotransferase
MLGLELSDKISGKDVVKTMLSKGFIINCTGHNTLRFVPPLIITKAEINQMINALNEIFGEITIA